MVVVTCVCFFLAYGKGNWRQQEAPDWSRCGVAMARRNSVQGNRLSLALHRKADVPVGGGRRRGALAPSRCCRRCTRVVIVVTLGDYRQSLAIHRKADEGGAGTYVVQRTLEDIVERWLGTIAARTVVDEILVLSLSVAGLSLGQRRGTL